MERLRTQAQSPVRARRNARQAQCSEAGRAHLHSVESELAQAAEANPIVPGLLHHRQALAQGELQTPQRRARKDEELTVRPTRYSHHVTSANFLLLTLQAASNVQKHILKAQRRVVIAQ